MRVQSSNMIFNLICINGNDKVKNTKKAINANSLIDIIMDILSHHDFRGRRVKARNFVRDLFSQETDNEVKRQTFISLISLEKVILKKA